MNRKELSTRIVALLAAVIVYFCAQLIIAIGAVDLFTEIVQKAAITHKWLQAIDYWPIVPGYRIVGSTIIWAYPICAGVTTAALFWRGWPQFGGRAVIYVFLMLLIAPMSWINYATSDQWLNLWVQAAFNLLMAIFFLGVVNALRSIESKAPDFLAIQSVGILMLTSFGVFLPLFFTSLFLAYAAGVLNHQQIQTIPDQAPLLFAGGAGAIATFLAQLDRLRTMPVTVLKDRIRNARPKP